MKVVDEPAKPSTEKKSEIDPAALKIDPEQMVEMIEGIGDVANVIGRRFLEVDDDVAHELFKPTPAEARAIANPLTKIAERNLALAVVAKSPHEVALGIALAKYFARSYLEARTAITITEARLGIDREGEVIPTSAEPSEVASVPVRPGDESGEPG